MKTTLNIDDKVMRRLKEEAARRQTTMSALVEAGLRLILDRESQPASTQDLPPLPTWHGGEELVNLADRDALYEAMEADEPRSGTEA